MTEAELTGSAGTGHYSPAHPAPGDSSALAKSAAKLACEVSELLEVMWGRDREVPTAPLSASQLRALFVLEHHNGVMLRTLAEALGSTPPSVSRLMDRLQAVGYVERAPSTSSRRELELRLTGRGRRYLAGLRAQRESEVSAVLAGMSPTAREALREGLAAFRDAAAYHTYAGHREPLAEPDVT